MSSTSNLAKLSVVQLRAKLKSRGLSTSGTKIELIERLNESILVEEKILNSDESGKDITDEEAVLNDSTSVNEDEVLGLTGPMIADIEVENSVLETKKGSESISEEVSKSKKNLDDETIDAKMKRALRFGLPFSSEQLKQKRAERFGLKDQLSPEEKKRSRAERFGITNISSVGNLETTKEILEKRAARFGLPIQKGGNSKFLVEPPSAEVLAKRAKRFGVSSEKAELEIKRQRRAERFGLS